MHSFRSMATASVTACLALMPHVATLVLTSTARAEDESTQASGSAAYQELIGEAVEEFRRGNYPEAYSLFERAHAVQPNARTLRGMGLAAFEERRYVACISHLRAALKDQRKPLTDKQRTHAEEVLQRAYGFVAQYTLELTPANAEVTVDSQPATIAEGILLLDPGEHEIVVSVEGHQETRHVEARPNDNLTLRIKLTAKRPEPGAVDADSAPWLTATHKAGVVLGGVGGASLVTSLALTLRARSKRDDSGCAAGSCPTAAAKDDYDSAVRLSKAATATAVIGGVGAAVGATLMLLDRGEREEGPASKTAQMRPTVGAGYAGLSVSGAW